MGIFRLGHVEVRVPDLELCAAYYTEVLGLVEVERQGKHVYLKGWDEHDHHSVILTEAPRYGLEHVAFKCESIDAHLKATCSQPYRGASERITERWSCSSQPFR